MKESSAIRIADQVLQNSDLFPNKGTDVEYDDEKKKDPLSSQIWRMYTQAKDNLPNGSRLENLTWRMMALSLKKKKDQELSSEQIDLKLEQYPSVPIVQDSHAYHLDSPLFFDESSTPSNYFCFEDISTSTSGCNSFHDNTTIYNQPAQQQTSLPNTFQSSPKSTSDISKRNRNQSPKSGLTQCYNCFTKNTPLWRRDPAGNPLCNACGLFLKLHGVVRPLSLKTDVIKKRNRTNNNQLNVTTTQTPPIAPSTTSSKTINKRRRHSNRQKNQDRELSDQELLLNTPLFMAPSSLPSSFYFSHTALSSPPGLVHSSSASSLVSLNPNMTYETHHLPPELSTYMTSPYPQDTNSLLSPNNDSFAPNNNTYFY